MVGGRREPSQGQVRPLRPVVEDPAQAVGPGLRVVRGQNGVTIRHQVGCRCAVGHEHGHAGGHGLQDRDPEPLVGGREGHDGGRCEAAGQVVGRDAAGTQDPVAMTAGIDCVSHVGLGVTRPTGQHEVGSRMAVSQAGERLDEHQVVLVRVGDRRVQDRGWARRLGRAGGNFLCSDRDGDHPGGIHPEPIDDLAPHLVADGHHQVGPTDRPGKCPSQVAAPDEREVPRMDERLEVVDGDGHRSARASRYASAKVVDCHAGGSTGQPHGLGEDPAGTTAAVSGVDVHIEGGAQVGVGVQCRAGQVDDRSEVRRAVAAVGGEGANGVLLGPTDVSGYQRQEVNGEAGHRPRAPVPATGLTGLVDFTANSLTGPGPLCRGAPSLRRWRPTSWWRP